MPRSAWLSSFTRITFNKPRISRQSSGKPEFIWGVTCIWLVMILVQALMGLMQLHGRIPSNHYLFNITGTFHNPGPFAGFVVSALPLALGVMLALKQFGYSGKGNRYLKAWKWQVKLHDNVFYLQKAMIFLCYGVIITLLLVIPAARSRAAWVGRDWQDAFTCYGNIRESLITAIS